MLFYVDVSREVHAVQLNFRPTHDQLLDEHSLADTSPSEKTNLSTSSVWGQEIDDFDTGDKDFSGCRLLDKLRSFGVDGQSLAMLDRTSLIDRVTCNVHDTAKGAGSDGNHDWCTSIGRSSSTDETLGTCEGVRVS